MSLLAVLVLAPATASALVLDIDPETSAIGGAPVTGRMRLAIGSQPPPSNRSFDLVELTAAAGDLDITLQEMASPGLGVLRADGAFLIPTLFLHLDDGSAPFDFAIPNVTGLLLERGAGCAHDHCLATSFEIDTGAAEGVIAVEIHAIPEPGTALLLALGLLGLGLRRTDRARTAGARR